MGQWSTPQGEHVYASHDGGATFAQSGTRVPISGAGGIASPGASSTFLTGTTAQGSAIVRSSDGGQTWQPVSGLGGEGQLNFIDQTAGWMIAKTGDSISLVQTKDGGATWAQLKPVTK